VLRALIAEYLERCGIEVTPAFEIDNYAMAISLVASNRGVAILPASAKNFLPWSVVSRPLEGDAPTIAVTVGFRRDNASPILKTFLSRIDGLDAA
jgi:LysR family hca operon transcriptional activator